MKECRNNILQCDVLFVDEVSMLSAQQFEQLEEACRRLRLKDTPFGGIQVILTGDFYQLPPVPNKYSQDPGEHCFLASIWKQCFPHKIILQDVMRQDQPDLIKAISELSVGQPSGGTNLLLQRLSRELPPGEEPILLYSDNLSVEIENRNRLMVLPGTVYTFNAEETYEDKAAVNQIRAPKILPLKIGCKVMLIKNLSKTLVNGLIGTVDEIQRKEVVVHFESCGLNVTLGMESFSIFDVKKGRVVAQRKQLPLTLGFALTVHKSQGMSLPRVIVDCSKMNQPGQMGVAIGRAVNKKGLNVINYKPSSCVGPSPAVHEFVNSKDTKTFTANLSCCSHPITTYALQIHNVKDMSDEELSDFTEEEILQLDELTTLSEQTTEEVYVSEHSYAATSPNSHSVPKDILAEDFIQQLTVKQPETPEQQQINCILVQAKANEALPNFIAYYWRKITELLTQSKTTKHFYKDFQAIFMQPEYKRNCFSLLGQISDMHSHVCAEILCLIRKECLKRAATSKVTSTSGQQNIPESTTREDTMPTPDVSGSSTETEVPRVIELGVTARGKIRYLAGRCIAKTKAKQNRLIRHNLYLSALLTAQPLTELKLMDYLTLSQREVELHTTDKGSLHEIITKQNLNQGLTNITDSVFNFFLSLEMKRNKLYTHESLVTGKENSLNQIKNKILVDMELSTQWLLLFRDFDCNQVPLGPELGVTAKERAAQAQQFCHKGIRDLFQEIVTRFLDISDNQFRKDILNSFGKKKTKAHRKKVLSKKKDTVKSTDQPTGTDPTVIGTESSGSTEAVTPVAETQTDTAILPVSEPIQIRSVKHKGKGKGKKSKKADPIETAQQPGTSESNPVVTAESGTLDDTAVLSSTETMQDTTVTSKHKGKGNGKKSKESCSRETGAAAATGRSKKKGKGKTKASKAKKLKKSVPEIELCPACDRECDDTEDAVCCSLCDTWWHRTCAGLISDEVWEQVQSDDWYCVQCSY